MTISNKPPFYFCMVWVQMLIILFTVAKSVSNTVCTSATPCSCSTEQLTGKKLVLNNVIVCDQPFMGVIKQKALHLF